MKQRFSSLDVKVISHELSNTLVSLRVANIYDLSSKIFLIKFAKPEVKQQIIIDSGFRCHLTKFSRATAAAPSVFVARLRKYLKTRRVTKVEQVGTDRIIEFQFSDGQYKLFLEFYAAGNIILTDNDLNIISLLRIVHEGEGQEELRVGLKYSLQDRQNYNGVPKLTVERLQNALQRGVEKGDEGLVAGKKPKRKSADVLRKALAVSITEFPPILVDHAMRVTGFDSTLKPADVLQNEALTEHLMRSLEEAQRLVKEITSSAVAKGYIISKKKAGADETAQVSGTGLVYEDFHSFKPKQFEMEPACVFLEFEGFNTTVDEFFSSIEGQKLNSRLEEREANANRKLVAARQDQAKRLGGLQEVQEMNERKASALQLNPERVREAIDAVNGLIGQGMDWVEIGSLIELEQKRNNSVAAMIKLPLKLEENTITILLDEEQFGYEEDPAYETDSDVSESGDEPEDKPKQAKDEIRLKIDLDLSLSPWANARKYFDQRKSAVDKEQKTLQSSERALKSQETKIASDLKRGLKQEKAVLRPVRRLMWFEKFIWFISSDGYLVLAGKDAQQNEMIYKKYLRKGDVYLHAEIHGAATVVVRNNPKTPDAPIPPSTLSQAGTLVVACSTAWDSKAGMSAWWANADQVSKTAPSGEFLPTGSFMVEGKKNFLPPAVLVLGFGVIFQISDDSKARHVKHRLHDQPKDDEPIKPINVTIETVRPAGLSINEQQLLESSHVSEAGDGSDSNKDEIDRKNGLRGNALQRQSPQIQRTDDKSVQEFAALDINEVQEPRQGPGGDSEFDNLSTPPTTGTQTPSYNNDRAPVPMKRGKKSKAKKIANKYKDQDEEDRIAAQQLIGASVGQEKARIAEEEKQKREAEIAFQKERRKAQHQRTQRETAEHEEIRKLLLEEGHEFPDDEEEKMTDLDSLIGMPLKGDEILEAIPICAPWPALGRYKYKAKLQPGTQKKGKAVKEILARWVGDNNVKGKVDDKSEDSERMWPREIELLKNWRPEEVTNTVSVGKVRVMMSGALQSSGTGKSKGSGKGAGGGRGRGRGK